MPEMPKYYGLCETCEHDSTCMLRRSTQLKIIQCEEFSIQPSTGTANAAASDTTLADFPDNVGMGLCSNCLHVATCAFPNARQGVLQCEEYLLDEAGVVPPVVPERSRSAA